MDNAATNTADKMTPGMHDRARLISETMEALIRDSSPRCHVSGQPRFVVSGAPISDGAWWVATDDERWTITVAADLSATVARGADSVTVPADAVYDGYTPHNTIVQAMRGLDIPGLYPHVASACPAHQ